MYTHTHTHTHTHTLVLEVEAFIQFFKIRTLCVCITYVQIKGHVK